eukprot:362627-Chlamydomonas_euryale.AAC.2
MLARNVGVKGTRRAGAGQLEVGYRAIGGQVEDRWRAGAGAGGGRCRAGGGQVEGGCRSTWRVGTEQVQGRWRAGAGVCGGWVQGRWSNRAATTRTMCHVPRVTHCVPPLRLLLSGGE